MSSCCCPCQSASSSSGGGRANLPLICMVPRQEGRKPAPGGYRQTSAPPAHGQVKLLSDQYIKKHFKLPKRALYLDPLRRPLITFPMTQEDARNFNLARKAKINQQILDGYLDKDEAISAPSVFPYAKTETGKRQQGGKKQEQELIYILQLPDWEFKCPVHQETIRTPRFIWHSCKKTDEATSSEPKRGGGPLHKPKPWLLSRHTDFDLLSQW